MSIGFYLVILQLDFQTARNLELAANLYNVRSKHSLFGI